MVSRSFPSVVTISFFSRLILLTRESDCDTVSEAHTKQSCVGRMKSGETQKVCLAGAVPLLLAPSNRLSVSGPSAYLEEYFACFTAPVVSEWCWWHGSGLFKRPRGNGCETSDNQLV